MEKLINSTDVQPNVEVQAPLTPSTPLMQQYWRIKAQYPEDILFFRLGDFYEMFYDDALKASPILEVVLTKRQNVPMCGIPYHAATAYISKLLKAGLRVAVAEQMEDPKKTKGMVKRDVVRVITPGTIIEDELLKSKANNFLLALANAPLGKKGDMEWALAVADVSTGRVWWTEVKEDSHLTILKSQITSLSPSEIILVGNSPEMMEVLDSQAPLRLEQAPSPSKNLKETAFQALKNYLNRGRAQTLSILSEPEPLPIGSSATLFLDGTAIRHLELVEPADPSQNSPTLLSLLDRCKTPLGSRLLRWWLLHPLAKKAPILERHHSVQVFYDDRVVRDDIRGMLKEITDLERINVRAQAGTASPRDLSGLRNSLLKIPQLIEALKRLISEEDPHPLAQLEKSLYPPATLVSVLKDQLADDPPIKLEAGGVIREGVSPALDELRLLRRSGKKWIADLEAQERGKTGIGSLKVGYNDVFGYYLEVSKVNLPKVPSDWIRKQTMANAERYITPALKEQEEKILGAEEKIHDLENKLFDEVLHQVASHARTVSRLAQGIAELDALSTLAEVAFQNDFVRPEISEGDEFVVKGGRHPIVEKGIGKDRFIPNDLNFGGEGDRLLVITGPNMAGKSTYLRQNALLAILAQMGSFVPAESARIGLVDKIFTRIGASDRLAQGESTFMVEMKEVAALLAQTTRKSLLILDEVGRGTSTYDGVSIAWAVIEHLAERGPRTLFATHYFELTQLSEKLSKVANAHATAKEWTTPDGKKHVIFLYQILSGPADRSYGIHVAEMAGLPATCTARAREILKTLEAGSHSVKGVDATHRKVKEQLSLFDSPPILDELKDLDVESMTPIEALNKLSELKKKL